jgi:hypothetical protein
VNRVVETHYRLRTALANGKGRLLEADRADMERQVGELTRYLLFADEAPLPEGGITGDPQLKEEFLSVRRTAANGESLRDFDLKSHLFTVQIFTPA